MEIDSRKAEILEYKVCAKKRGGVEGDSSGCENIQRDKHKKDVLRLGTFYMTELQTEERVTEKNKGEKLDSWQC